MAELVRVDRTYTRSYRAVVNMVPPPVALNRFAAALRVFSLGIGLLVRTQTTTIRPDVPPPE